MLPSLDDPGARDLTMDLERWLWRNAGDWIDGRPGELTRERLAAVNPEDVPSDLLTYLAPALALAAGGPLAAAAVARGGSAVLEEERQRAAALSIGATLERRGLGHAWFKGMDLRYRVYPDPHRRDSQDLDLLCAEDDRRGVRDGLLADGWADEGDPGAWLDGELHETALRRANVVVDVHTGPVQPGRTRFSARDVVERSVGVAVDGGDLRVPAREDAVALCLVHVGVHEGAGEHVAFKHGLDLARASIAWPDLDWDVVAARATAWGCRRLASAGLWTWRDRLGSLLPTAASERLRPDPLLRWLAGGVRDGTGPERIADRGIRRLVRLVRKFVYAEGWRERRWLVGELVRRATGGSRDRPRGRSRQGDRS